MNINNNLIAIIFSLMIFVSGCDSESVNTQDIENIDVLPVTSPITVEKIEIYHFHATSQCVSCKTVGAYAEETVNTYFADEVESGKIVFAHINGDLVENRGLVVKYGATGSSLWIGVYDSNGFHKEENVNVWYKIDNKEGYMNYLKGIIEQKLAGN